MRTHKNVPSLISKLHDDAFYHARAQLMNMIYIPEVHIIVGKAPTADGHYTQPWNKYDAMLDAETMIRITSGEAGDRWTRHIHNIGLAAFLDEAGLDVGIEDATAICITPEVT